ncbi:MAG: PepSY domain-containing protein [Gemella haemolysans]|uniref:PepSY domain-containing protein n=1 Tax=Gemella haemolysans TaxID=1379 RepID=UPI00290807B2|nr:PepSY domain-containing protein [Gemella haemolysans]MDU6573905.1 PepSY domain-containing protein [Gemella haemolysans]
MENKRNNEIETIEGNYTENVHSETQYNEQPKKVKRNFLKPLIIGALAVVVTGGVGAYAYDKYETSQRAKIQEAYSNIKMNVGSQSNQNNNNNTNSGDNGSNTNSQNDNQSSNVQNNNNSNNTQQNVQNAKSQQEIRSIVAQAISTPEQNINFVKVRPEYEDDYAPQNNGMPLYVYEVEARANGLEYDVVVDAVSGKVLKVEIDN